MPPKGRSCNQTQLFLGMPGQISLCPAEVWQHHSKFQLCCNCGFVRIKAKAQELVLSQRATLEYLREFCSCVHWFPKEFSCCFPKGFGSNWNSAWSHPGQAFAFTSQSLLGAILSFIKEVFQQGEKQEEKIPNSLCVVLFPTEISLDERSHSGWISWNVVSGLTLGWACYLKRYLLGFWECSNICFFFLRKKGWESYWGHSAVISISVTGKIPC